MRQKRKFTIWHGLAASIAVHGVLGAPFIVSVIAAPPEEPRLFIELQGDVPDSQDLAEIKQSEVDQKKGQLQQPQPKTPEIAKEPTPQQTTPTDEPPMEVAATDEALHNLPQPASTPPLKAVEAPPPAPEMKAAPDNNNVKGATEYVPPARKFVQVEISDQDYGAQVVKKVRENRVVPDEVKSGGVQGVTTVSFLILSDGNIRPETLKVAKSSGRPVLDAAALSAVRASAPFAPPPREMAVAFDVAFGPRR
jgi:periplasmic protein TonB